MQLDFRVYPHQTLACEYILFSLIRILSISVINAIIPEGKEKGAGKDKRRLKGWKSFSGTIAIQYMFLHENERKVFGRSRSKCQHERNPL